MLFHYFLDPPDLYVFTKNKLFETFFLLVQNAILLSSSHMSFDARSNLIAILLRYYMI